MVKGLDSFIAQFRDFTDCYTVIGGAACDILMSEAGLEFRATKDVDMILILEDPGRFTGFCRAVLGICPAGRIHLRVEKQ